RVGRHLRVGGQLVEITARRVPQQQKCNQCDECHRDDGGREPRCEESGQSHGDARPGAVACGLLNGLLGSAIMSRRLGIATRYTASLVAAAALSGALLAAPANLARVGGALAVAQPSEPKTFNPALALDQPTRDVLYLLSADLVHINRQTLKTEPALAE